MFLKRAPAVWLGLIRSLLALLVALDVVDFTPDQSGTVLAVIAAASAVALALAVHPFAWPLLTGLVQAVLALLLAFGFALTQTQQGAILAALSASLIIMEYGSVTPEVFRPAIARRRQA